MSYYVTKNISVDLVDNTVDVRITCDARPRPTVITVNFPLHITAGQSEGDLKTQARDKLRLVLGRALAAIEQEG